MVKGASGRSGGMAFWWRKSCLSVIEVFRDRYMLSCRCQSPQGDMEWLMSCIYGPCVATDKVGLWEELSAMHQRVQEVPWLLGGDFNCYLLGNDNPDGRVDSSMAGFQLAMQNMGLTDIPSVVWNLLGGMAVDRFPNWTDFLAVLVCWRGTNCQQ